MRHYARNRVLRMYPGLWVCLAVSIAFFLSAGVALPSAGAFAAWFAAQATFFQFYNPAFLRGFGVGALNGSLWTIAVELQFYIALPLLALAARRYRVRGSTIAIACLPLMYAGRWLIGPEQTIPEKLVAVSLVPYLFYFVLGIVARSVHERWPRVFEGKGAAWVAAYACWVAAEHVFRLDGATGNVLNPISIVLLGCTAVAVAYTVPGLSNRILRGNDVSYGVYIYHMPVINLCLAEGIGGMTGVVAALAGTTACAVLSWRYVEQPALRMKRYSARRDEDSAVAGPPAAVLEPAAPASAASTRIGAL